MTVNSIDRQHSSSYKYNHADYALRRRVCRILLRAIGFTLLAKVDRWMVGELPATGSGDPDDQPYCPDRPDRSHARLPAQYRAAGQDRGLQLSGYCIFPRIWGVIPVRREEFDRRAVQQVLVVLNAGEIVLVAPEGTRSPQ